MGQRGEGQRQQKCHERRRPSDAGVNHAGGWRCDREEAMRLTHGARALSLLSVVLVGSPVSAENFPSRPIRVIVSSSAGGLQDQLARGVADGLRALWGQQLVI